MSTTRGAARSLVTMRLARRLARVGRCFHSGGNIARRGASPAMAEDERYRDSLAGFGHRPAEASSAAASYADLSRLATNTYRRQRPWHTRVLIASAHQRCWLE